MAVNSLAAIPTACPSKPGWYSHPLCPPAAAGVPIGWFPQPLRGVVRAAGTSSHPTSTPTSRDIAQPETKVRPWARARSPSRKQGLGGRGERGWAGSGVGQPPSSPQPSWSGGGQDAGPQNKGPRKELTSQVAWPEVQRRRTGRGGP